MPTWWRKTQEQHIVGDSCIIYSMSFNCMIIFGFMSFFFHRAALVALVS